jgi:hypothetical protein
MGLPCTLWLASLTVYIPHNTISAEISQPEE